MKYYSIKLQPQQAIVIYKDTGIILNYQNKSNDEIVICGSCDYFIGSDAEVAQKIQELGLKKPESKIDLDKLPSPPPKPPSKSRLS